MNGLILQWGLKQVAGGIWTIDLPIAFTSQYNVVATVGSADSSVVRSVGYATNSLSKFTAYANSSVNTPLSWLAIGY